MVAPCGIVSVMKPKIARRSSTPTNNPPAKAKRPRRAAVNPTRTVKAVRSVVTNERAEPLAYSKDPRTHSAQPTSFLSHSLQLRPQYLGRAGR